MAHYLIEFRFFGKAKAEAKNLIWDVNRRFHIRPKYRPVPHVSLAGDFSTSKERRLIDDFKNICKKQDIMQFKTVGFNTFEYNRVVYIEIEPDTKLDDFRWRLSQTLQSYCGLTPYDLERKFNFHATIAMNLPPKKFEQVKRYISKKPKPNFRNVLLRVALIKNQKILCEYDFLLKRLLNGRKAISREILSKTFDVFKKYLGILEPVTEIDLDAVEKSFFSKLKNLFGKRKKGL
jgi:2'-5' RNA ligase